MAEVENEAVPSSLVHEIHSWIEAGASSDDVIGRLRLRCVPPGFTPHPWTPGMSIIESGLLSIPV